jgi:hypothetical protein
MSPLIEFILYTLLLIYTIRKVFNTNNTSDNTIDSSQLKSIQYAFRTSMDYSDFIRLMKHENIDTNQLYTIWNTKKTTLKMTIEFDNIDSIFDII